VLALTTGSGVFPIMVNHGVDWRKENSPVGVEMEVVAYAEKKSKYPGHAPGRTATDGSHARFTHLVFNLDFSHKIEIIANQVMSGWGVLDLGEIVQNQLERCANHVAEMAKVVVILGVELRKGRSGFRRLYPDDVVGLDCIVMSRASV
jgi:hypothetical protein